MGHEGIEMALRYAHLTPDVKREAVQLLDGDEIRSLAPDEHQSSGQERSTGTTGA